MRIWYFITPLCQLAIVLMIAGAYFGLSSTPESRTLGINALIIATGLLFLKVVFGLALRDKLISLWWIEGATAVVLFLIVILHELHVPYFGQSPGTLFSGFTDA